MDVLERFKEINESYKRLRRKTYESIISVEVFFKMGDEIIKRLEDLQRENK